MSSVVRPDWWCYPLQCPAGHPWAPGRITVGWMPCDCRNAQANNVLGHLWVRCRADGCRSIWYRPRHEPGAQGLAELSGIVLVAAWRGGCRAWTALRLVTQVRQHSVMVG